MEFIRTNNLKTALLAFQDALLISYSDPLVYNEIGVVFFKQKMYQDAEMHFAKGLEICKEDKSLVYQNLTINLGHTYRKLKYIIIIKKFRKFDEAIFLFNKVVKMDNRNVSVLSALAYSLHLKGEYTEALDIYHKVNFIKSDDPFTIEMINKCLNDMIDQAN